MQYKINHIWGRKSKKPWGGEGDYKKYTPLEGLTLKNWGDKHFIKNIWILRGIFENKHPNTGISVPETEANVASGCSLFMLAYKK